MTAPDGTPVGGVRVAVCRHRPSDYNPPRPLDEAGPPDLDRVLAGLVDEAEKDHVFRQTTPRQAVSGADGSFVLTGLDDGDCEIRAFREGYAVRFAGERGGANPGETVALVAERLVFGPLAPGECEIVPSVSRSPYGDAVVQRVRVLLASGPREETLPLPPLLILTVEAAEAGVATRSAAPGAPWIQRARSRWVGPAFGRGTGRLRPGPGHSALKYLNR